MRDDNITADLPLEPTVRSPDSCVLGPGTVLDQRYEILSVIGKGAFGTVYRARHRVLDDVRAIKVLPLLARNDTTSTQRFLREARILAKLKHPNIVEVSDAGMTPDGQRYLVMELLSGQTLADWLAKTPLENRDAPFIQTLLMHFVRLCEALDTAHEQGIVHRDLRPANIFLHQDCYETVVKLLDFGVARVEDDTRLTLTGDTLGTVAYMPPEQVRGQAPDPRFDTYALGVVLYEALTGRLPVVMDGTMYDAIERLLRPTAEVAPPESFNPHVRRALSRVCLRAIERAPEARYPSAEELCEELSKLTPYSTPADRVSKEPSKVRRRPVWLLVALLVCAGCAATAWWFATSSVQSEHIALARSSGLALKASRPRAVIWPAFQPPAAWATMNEAGESEPVRPISMSPPSQSATMIVPASGPSAEELLAQCNSALRALRLDEAQPCFEKVSNTYPETTAQASFGLGRVSFERKQYSQASHHLSQAVSLLDKPSWRVLLGQALLLSGDKQAAASQWQKVAQQTGDGEAQTRAKSLLAANGFLQ